MSYTRAKSPAEAERQLTAELFTLGPRLEGDEYAAELACVTAILEGAHWVFAKSMPETPHWYTVVDRPDHGWIDPEEFYRCVAFIRLYGYRHTFRGWPYTQLDTGGFTYWTMGYPVRMTTLINRKPIR